jgi:hypothetical protein
VEFLALQNEARGPQAWGVWGPSAGIIKGLGRISENADRWGAMAREPSGFGHTRFATSGGQSARHAHPWHIGRVIGAHNGQIYNAEDLRAEYRYPGTVDSQVLLAHLSAGRPMAELEGYGTVQWVEVGRLVRGIHLCRLTDCADLWVAKVDGVGVVWSSDARHGREALAACGIPAAPEFRVEPGATYRASEGVLFRTDAPDRAITRSMWGGGWSSGYSAMPPERDDTPPLDPWASEECLLCGRWIYGRSTRLGLCSTCERYEVA